MKYKVLFLTDSLGNGGAERQLALLVKYLPSDWECRVFSWSDGPFAKKMSADNIQVKIHERKFQFDLRPAFSIWHLISEWKPDIVHSWGWMSSVAAGPWCNAMGVRFIDGTIRMGKKFPRRQFAQFLGMSWADRIIANSQAGLDVWEIATPKGKVVYNGFEPERLSLCVSPKTKSAFFTVVMVGRMTFEKDFQTFFKAARTLLVDAETTWHFMAIGKGVDYKNHLETNKDLVEKGQLEILDGGTEVLPLLNQAQVGVLISTFGEGCSNAIMEYMACGLPVICNDSGGNRELVIDGETGFLIPNGDCQALVSKLAYLRDNPYEAERLGQAGRQRLLTHYTVDVLVQETIRVYKEVI